MVWCWSRKSLFVTLSYFHSAAAAYLGAAAAYLGAAAAYLGAEAAYLDQVKIRQIPAQLNLGGAWLSLAITEVRVNFTLLVSNLP